MRAILLVMVLSLSGCVTLQNTGTSIKNWWDKPETKEHLAVIGQQVFVASMAAAGESIREYITTGTVDAYKVGAVAAASIVFQQASNIRKLQGTSQVLDPVATAQALVNSGTPKEAATVLASQIVDNTQKLVNAGMTPDAAQELNAEALDAKASLLTTSAQ